MRNLLATVPKAQSEMVAVTVRTIFAQPDETSTRHHLRLRLPNAAGSLRRSRQPVGRCRG
jgi:transposase-like protein